MISSSYQNTWIFFRIKLCILGGETSKSRANRVFRHPPHPFNNFCREFFRHLTHTKSWLQKRKLPRNRRLARPPKKPPSGLQKPPPKRLLRRPPSGARQEKLPISSSPSPAPRARLFPVTFPEISTLPWTATFVKPSNPPKNGLGPTVVRPCVHKTCKI